jgi:hypothetical protein
MSWSNIINKKDTPRPPPSEEEFNESSGHGGVKDWKRPMNTDPIGKVIDLKQHVTKVQEYRNSRPRPRYLPDALLDEKQRQAIRDIKESEYWDRKYAESLPTDEEVTDEELDDH